MLQVSDAYKELVKSNIRPKCEPIIKVSGEDDNGNNIELVWQASDIKDLRYKKAIDPIGRELPYMELTWTEIYTGEFNAENYPEKYNNIAKYMAVELSFVQDLAFYNTWKTIFNSGLTWKELFLKNSTWKQLKRNILQEIIKMPKLFLEARPSIKGKTITWKARDFLYFCDKPIRDATFGIAEIPFFAPLVSSGYIDHTYTSATSKQLTSTTQKTRDNFINAGDRYNKNSGYTLSKRIFVDSIYSDFFLNYLKIKNLILKFKQDGSLDVLSLNDITELEIVDINKSIMYSLPELIREQPISNYVFEFTNAKLNESQNYEVKYSYEAVLPPETPYTLFVFEFNGFGEAQYKFNEYATTLLNDPNGLEAIAESVETLVVTPLSLTYKEESKNIREYGVDFQEKNPINPFSYRIETTDITEPKELDISNLIYQDGNEPYIVSTLYDMTPTSLDFGEVLVGIENGLSLEELNERGFIVGKKYRITISFNEVIPVLRKIELMPEEIGNVEFINERADFFKKFFNDKNYIIKCETLPILMLEPCDIVHVDRGLSDSKETNDQQSIITEIEISYNGALKQKMTMHECSFNYG